MVNELIDKYYKFLKGKTAVITETGSNWAVISTPFIGLFNDTLKVYVKKEHGKILMSDDGVTIKNLELIGSTVSRSPKRKGLLERILLTYGVQMQGDEFIVEATENNFAQKKHNLISAIYEINNMYMLAKHTVASVFKEDVQGYLDEQ